MQIITKIRACVLAQSFSELRSAVAKVPNYMEMKRGTSKGLCISSQEICMGPVTRGKDISLCGGEMCVSPLTPLPHPPPLTIASSICILPK